MAPLRIPSHWRGMLGTLLTGRLCISIIQTLFPLGGDWELLEGRSLWDLWQSGLAPFSQSP